MKARQLKKVIELLDDEADVSIFNAEEDEYYGLSETEPDGRDDANLVLIMGDLQDES